MHNPSTSNLDEDDLNDDNLGEDGFGLSDLSSYFHQDWSLRFATERGVVIAYVTELPPAFARVLAEDAQHLVNHGDGHLANDLWQAAAGLSNGSRSIPIGLGWLEEVIEVCNELLPTPTTSDTVVNEVDPATANRLLAEIDALEPTLTQRISTKYGQEIPTFSRSLRTCVTDISPDLAFRLLLRALTQYGVDYSLEQHARFVELGKHFSYGELVVLTTEYLAY